jgi:hypothetical protein
MFRSRHIIVATALALCAASTAPALARVPDQDRPKPASSASTHRCQHSLTTTDAAGSRVTTTTTYGARCLEA